MLISDLNEDIVWMILFRQKYVLWNYSWVPIPVWPAKLEKEVVYVNPLLQLQEPSYGWGGVFLF